MMKDDRIRMMKVSPLTNSEERHFTKLLVFS
jgi:hypothetical protein